MKVVVVVEHIDEVRQAGATLALLDCIVPPGVTMELATTTRAPVMNAVRKVKGETLDAIGRPDPLAGKVVRQGGIE